MQGNTLNSNPSTTFTTPLNTIHSSNDQHENTHHTISTLKTCQLLYTAPIQNQQQPHFVDFITQSSYDILCCILHHLDTESVATCTLVSHAWRDILIEIPSPWRHIVVSLGKSQNALTTVLPMVSNYIKKLSFFNNIYLKFGTMLQNIHSLITTYPFSNLSSLLISDQCIYIYFQIMQYYSGERKSSLIYFFVTIF
ncbi:hypothetical protein BDA99DRAFT_316839 [Phascolomyces articulosus]|uniref:F-box domain-containing protein n=1 Tax=Phascolomyces articulosus TaxID=60185 RepID=A0AAD5P6Z0_9FUNG|nr:hypothetical protein BDA99DRAFT_316839 [Phascolomyces articulosus]